MERLDEQWGDGVRNGNRVTIGPGPNIGRFEHGDSFSRSAKSVVREEARV